MSRTKLFVFAALFLVILVTAACVAPAAPVAEPAAPAAEEPAAEPTEEPAAEAVMLELSHDKPSWTPNTDQMGQSAAEAIGVGFVTVPYNDPDVYKATVRAALTTDKAPDLFTWWSGYQMEDIVKAGGAADLTEIWQKYIDSGEYGKSMADAFTFDGKVYGVPNNLAYWVVYYNKPLFEANGLTPPTTWDEYMALNETLKSKDIIPMAQTFVDTWQAFIMFEEMIMRTQGPEFYAKLMNGEIKYTDPGVVEAMDAWKELIEKGYVTNDYSFGTAENSFLPEFQNGNIAMVLIGDWYSTTLVGAGMVPGEDYDAFILPNKNADLPPSIFFEVGPLLVAEKSPNKEDAKKVADWWMSVDAQNEWNGLNGFSPANNKADPPSVVGKSVQDWIVANQAQTVLRFWEATPSDIVNTTVSELARFMLNPDEAMSVLEAIQAKADEVWAARQ